jgi:hypothetical protein
MGGKRASAIGGSPAQGAGGGRAVPAAAGGRELPRFPESVFGVRFEAVGKAWDCAKGLFDPKAAPARLAAMAPQAGGRLALALFALGGFVIFLIWLLSSIEYIYVLNFESELVGSVTGEALPKLDASVLLPVAAYDFVLWCVAVFIINLAHEGIAFYASRLIGGRGTLPLQLYLSGIVWLAISMSMVAVLVGPLYLLCAVTVASLVFVTLLYLGVYMTARALAAAHGLDFSYALTIAIILAAARVLTISLAIDILSALTGISTLTG